MLPIPRAGSTCLRPVDTLVTLSQHPSFSLSRRIDQSIPTKTTRSLRALNPNVPKRANRNFLHFQFLLYLEYIQFRHLAFTTQYVVYCMRIRSLQLPSHIGNLSIHQSIFTTSAAWRKRFESGNEPSYMEEVRQTTTPRKMSLNKVQLGSSSRVQLSLIGAPDSLHCSSIS